MILMVLEFINENVHVMFLKIMVPGVTATAHCQEQYNPKLPAGEHVCGKLRFSEVSLRVGHGCHAEVSPHVPDIPTPNFCKLNGHIRPFPGTSCMESQMSQMTKGTNSCGVKPCEAPNVESLTRSNISGTFSLCTTIYYNAIQKSQNCCSSEQSDQDAISAMPSW